MKKGGFMTGGGSKRGSGPEDTGYGSAGRKGKQSETTTIRPPSFIIICKGGKGATQKNTTEEGWKEG